MLKDIILEDADRVCSRVAFGSLENKTLLVTGASGLLGTHFLGCFRCLLSKGMKIKVIAQVYKDPPQHISEIVNGTSIEVVKLDLSKDDFAKELPEMDYVIHAAGYAQPLRFLENPLATVKVNIGATISLLERMKPAGRFLFLSSAEVYTGLDKSIFSEECIGSTDPYHPRASYIEGKRCGETVCNIFRQHRGIHAMSARLGDVFGPGTRKHDKRALNSFIEKAIVSGKIELLDSGSATRTYGYISDALESLFSILLHGKSVVYNVGGKSVTTIAQLAELIARFTKVPVIFPQDKIEGVSGAPKKLQLDLTRVEKEFGKKDHVTMEEGLRRAIDWQRNLYSLDQKRD